jgi:hypothetical protein
VDCSGSHSGSEEAGPIMTLRKRPRDPAQLCVSIKRCGPRPYLGEKPWNGSAQKTSIAGIQVSNWMIALGAIIVILLAYSFMR